MAQHCRIDKKNDDDKSQVWPRVDQDQDQAQDQN